jgi:dethiobiotin synthetase
MAPIRGLFFTGTDTGVGKTYVTAAVTRILRQQGRGVRVCKPVATGVRADGFSEDTVQLAAAAGLSAEEWGQVTRWAFEAPAAPPVAARRQGVELRLDDVVRAVVAQAEAHSALLVEGVGGLHCPLTDTETIADLAARLAMPLVIVTRRSLGTLNHTLLTLEVAGNRKLRVAGLVVNETSLPQSLAEETNVEELRRRIDVPLLAVVPYEGRSVQESLPELDRVDWWRLCLDSRRKASP